MVIVSWGAALIAKKKFSNMGQEFLDAGGPPGARLCEKTHLSLFLGAALIAQNKFPNKDQEFLGAGGPPGARLCEKNATKPFFGTQA